MMLAFRALFFEIAFLGGAVPFESGFSMIGPVAFR
jgi:hypothetical protein